MTMKEQVAAIKRTLEVFIAWTGQSSHTPISFDEARTLLLMLDGMDGKEATRKKGRKSCSRELQS